jgi:hypothetical protein
LVVFDMVYRCLGAQVRAADEHKNRWSYMPYKK